MKEKVDQVEKEYGKNNVTFELIIKLDYNGSIVKGKLFYNGLQIYF